MTVAQLVAKYESLPDELKKEAEAYIDSLHEQANSSGETDKLRPIGMAKGRIWMSDDFDEPLEDFKDYM